MKLFFASITAMTVFTATGLSLAENTPNTPGAPVKEKHMSAQSLLNMELAGLIQIHQALAEALDSESAAKAAKKLEVLREKIRGFDKMIESLSEDEEKQLIALEEKMASRFILLYKRCMTEGKRIMDTDYFYCEPLKAVMNSYEFADIVLPPANAENNSADDNSAAAPEQTPEQEQKTPAQ